MWATVSESCDVNQCARLFKYAFKIRNTPQNTVKSKPKRRLLGNLSMASQRISNHMDCDTLMSDKENGAATCSSYSPSPQKIRRLRCPLEDYDPNSQDSGYGASLTDKEEKSRDGFQFVEPSGVAPRRMSVECRSPMASPLRSSPRQRAMRSSFFRSLSSGYESLDDGFNELIDLDTLDDTTQLPSGISTLLSGHIVASETPMECNISTTPEYARNKCIVNLGRSLPLESNSIEKHKGTRTLSKVRSCLFRSPNTTSSTARITFDDHPLSEFYIETESPSQAKCSKRSEPPVPESPKLVKRFRKSNSFCLDISEVAINSKCSLQRSLSETETHAHIKSAIHRSITDADLTGDFSKPCILPLATGDHEDLKSISCNTLAALIRGEFNDRVTSFKIVDCRYPYEFDGGHIDGALNLYSKDLIERILFDPLTTTPMIQPDTNKRNILVLHCEFSWERGPNLLRFLRGLDRQRNKEHYPALHYPEIYLLHGGYEQFYKEQKEFCLPQSYRPMKHPDHEADLRQFRTKSKSWQGEKTRINNETVRANLKRLGF